MGIGSSACRYGFTVCRKPIQRMLFVLLVTAPLKGTKKRIFFSKEEIAHGLGESSARLTLTPNKSRNLPIEPVEQHKHGTTLLPHQTEASR